MDGEKRAKTVQSLTASLFPPPLETLGMTDLDPETFDEKKYVDYFPKLQQAYKNAFNRLNEKYNSEMVHAIDQQILNESEPFYEGDGEFRIEIPENPTDRVQGVLADDDDLRELLDIYVEELERQHRRIFGFDE